MIGEKGENLGVLSREEALLRAKAQGTDLIEIAPHAKPPVARLISFDKYRYEKEKEFKKERLAQKNTGSKQGQISARAAENDLRVKLRQLEKFMAEGHPIEIRVRLRGREKRNTEWAFQKLRAFMGMIAVPYKVTSEPKAGGFGISVQITKK